MSTDGTGLPPVLPPSPQRRPIIEVPNNQTMNIPPPVTNYAGFPNSSSSNSSTYSRFFTVAVICLSLVSCMVLFLHLYLRYLRRQHMIRHRQTSNLLRLTTFNLAHSESPREGLDRTAISTIPSFQYQKEAGSNTENSTASVVSNSIECAVCLSSLEEGDVVRMLPACRHIFHVACIDKWLISSASCPVCRADVSPQTQEQAQGQGQGQSRSRSQSLSTVLEVSDAPTQEHNGTKEEAEAGSTSVSTRLSSSFRRMMSRNRSLRRVQDDTAEEDLERGNGANSSN